MGIVQKAVAAGVPIAARPLQPGRMAIAGPRRRLLTWPAGVPRGLGQGRVRSAVWSSAALLAALIALLLALAVPASAGVHNPIPADASGDLQDTFVDDDALFAYATVDIAGGEMCIVDNVDEMEGQSCQRPAWGTPNTIVGIGTTYTLLEAPSLVPGTWRLLAVDSVGEPSALSIPFTVSPCQDCSREIASSVVAEWKARAGQARVGAQVMCTAWAIQGAAEIPGKITAAQLAREIERKARQIAARAKEHLTMRWSERRTAVRSHFEMTSTLPLRATRALVRRRSSCSR